MIRPTIFMGVLLIAMLVFAVFQVEYRVHNLKTELEEINRQMIAGREEIHVLKAEWSYLNNPNRIRELSEKHLALDNVLASQVGDINIVPLRTVMVGSR